MKVVCGVCCALVFLVGSARAQDSSLTVVGDEQLAAATRIQFLGDRRVRSGAWPDGRRGIEAASEVRNAEQSDLVAWSEPGSSPNEAVLFVLGPAPGRAVLQIVHLHSPPGPDRTRALAIKLREVIDALEIPDPGANVLGQERGPFEGLLGVAALRGELWTPGADAPLHGEVGLRAGLRWSWFQASLGLVLAPPVTLLDAENAAVDVTTITALLNVSALLEVGRFRFGGSLEFRLRTLVFSGGVPPASRSESVFSPGLLAALHADFRLIPGLYFRLSPGMAWFPVQEHVRLGGPRLVSLPRLAGVLGTEIIWEF